jgi:hypothetical protein
MAHLGRAEPVKIVKSDLPPCVGIEELGLTIEYVRKISSKN